MKFENENMKTNLNMSKCPKLENIDGLELEDICVIIRYLKIVLHPPE